MQPKIFSLCQTCREFRWINTTRIGYSTVSFCQEWNWALSSITLDCSTQLLKVHAEMVIASNLPNKIRAKSDDSHYLPDT